MLAENRVGRTTPVALVVLLLKEDLDLTAGLMVRGHVVPVVLVVQEGLGLTAGHMVRVGHMVAHPSRKGDPDRTANQISTTRANQISTTRRDSAGLGARGWQSFGSYLVSGFVAFAVDLTCPLDPAFALPVAALAVAAIRVSALSISAA